MSLALSPATSPSVCSQGGDASRDRALAHQDFIRVSSRGWFGSRARSRLITQTSRLFQDEHYFATGFLCSEIASYIIGRVPAVDANFPDPERTARVE